MSSKASQIVGVTVSLASIFPRLPQIYWIMHKRSVEGLSHGMFVCEALCSLLSVLYSRAHSHPLNTYGEVVCQTVQTSFILALFAKIRGTLFRDGALSVAVTALSLKVLKQPKRYIKLLSAIQVVNSLATQVGRVPQILTNHKSKGTGQLSSVPYVANTMGSLLRLFTTREQLGGDPILILGFVASFLVNSILAVQILHYSPSRALQNPEKLRSSEDEVG